jgi:Tol biopolymer transport system component
VGPVLWWSVLEPHGTYLTHERAGGRAVMESSGTDMGIAGCGLGLVLSSSRSGDAEVWWARHDGSDLRQLTTHAGIDVSPTCADGRLAFVSNRDGTPRVFLSSFAGTARDLAITTPIAATSAGETQTPSLCHSSRGLLLAYTRLGGAMRVELLDVTRGQRRVLSPPGWAAKDPSFSPDCRFVAYVARGQGIVVASVDDPTRRRVVLSGAAETVRWGPAPEPLGVVSEHADALAAPR